MFLIGQIFYDFKMRVSSVLGITTAIEVNRAKEERAFERRNDGIDFVYAVVAILSIGNQRKATVLDVREDCLVKLFVCIVDGILQPLSRNPFACWRPISSTRPETVPYSIQKKRARKFTEWNPFSKRKRGPSRVCFCPSLWVEKLPQCC